MQQLLFTLLLFSFFTGTQAQTRVQINTADTTSRLVLHRFYPYPLLQDSIVLSATTPGVFEHRFTVAQTEQWSLIIQHQSAENGAPVTPNYKKLMISPGKHFKMKLERSGSNIRYLFSGPGAPAQIQLQELRECIFKTYEYRRELPALNKNYKPYCKGLDSQELAYSKKLEKLIPQLDSAEIALLKLEYHYTCLYLKSPTWFYVIRGKPGLSIHYPGAKAHKKYLQLLLNDPFKLPHYGFLLVRADYINNIPPLPTDSGSRMPVIDRYFEPEWAPLIKWHVLRESISSYYYNRISYSRLQRDIQNFRADERNAAYHEHLDALLQKHPVILIEK